MWFLIGWFEKKGGGVKKSLELFGPKHLLSVYVCMQVNRNGERVEEKLQVFLRVRPLTDAERQRGEDQVTLLTSHKYDYFIQYIKRVFLFFNIVCACTCRAQCVCRVKTHFSWRPLKTRTAWRVQREECPRAYISSPSHRYTLAQSVSSVWVMVWCLFEFLYSNLPSALFWSAISAVLICHILKNLVLYLLERRTLCNILWHYNLLFNTKLKIFC